MRVANDGAPPPILSRLLTPPSDCLILYKNEPFGLIITNILRNKPYGEVITKKLKNEPFGEIITNILKIKPYGEITRTSMNLSDAKSFGKMLRLRRKELGYTQAFLADFSGFSVSFISDLERGKETAELGKALYLAQLLGLDLKFTTRT